MGTRTIGLDDEAYERLDAIKREDESFSDLVKRLTDTVTTDWRRGFGKYSDEEGERFKRAVEQSREATAVGLARRQARVLAAFDEERDDVPNGDRDAGDEA